MYRDRASSDKESDNAAPWSAAGGAGTDLALIAPAGHYIALRIGFAYPIEEVNALPQPWAERSTRAGLMMADAKTGAEAISRAASFGLI